MDTSPFGRRPYSPHERGVILRLRADGFTWKQIAAALGRSSGQAVQQHANAEIRRAEDAQARAKKATKRKVRACLRCSDRFMSPHAGVRMCDGCRGFSASPFEPDHNADESCPMGIFERDPKAVPLVEDCVLAEFAADVESEE